MRMLSACLIVFSGLAITQDQARAERLFAVTTDDRLLSFDSSNPGAILSEMAISGLAGGESLIGIDFRPATGQVFGVGSTGILHNIDITTGQASTVANLTQPLNGTSFGIDFNPTVDRLRIVSDANQNLRVVPDTGQTFVDTALAYVSGDPNAGMNPNVSATAYTNSFPGATETTQYVIDSALNTLAIQRPPNDGLLTTVGALGVVTSDIIGFDISGFTGIAYAALNPPNTSFSDLYTINLDTGAASFVGRIGGGAPIVGLTAVPEPTSIALMGLGIASLVGYSWRRKARRS